jgi:hypothetical protein
MASIERPKSYVMHEIKRAVHAENFDETPLICVMDGAKALWTCFQEVFKEALIGFQGRILQWASVTLNSLRRPLKNNDFKKDAGHRNRIV